MGEGGTRSISLPVVPEIFFFFFTWHFFKSNLEVWYHSSSAGRTCSSFFPVLQQSMLNPCFSYFLCHTPGYIFGTSETKAKFHSQRQTGALSRIKNPARVSVVDGFLLAGNKRTNMAAPKKTYKKNIVHPFLLFI